jgi:hypothetical protein
MRPINEDLNIEATDLEDEAVKENREIKITQQVELKVTTLSIQMVRVVRLMTTMPIMPQLVRINHAVFADDDHSDHARTEAPASAKMATKRTRMINHRKMPTTIRRIKQRIIKRHASEDNEQEDLAQVVQAKLAMLVVARIKTTVNFKTRNQAMVPATVTEPELIDESESIQRHFGQR